MAEHIYKTRGTCSKSIAVELDGRIIKRVEFSRGCSGNLRGLSLLVPGMDIDTVISRFKDLRCDDMPSSCPAQLALALQAAYDADQRADGVSKS